MLWCLLLIWFVSGLDVWFGGFVGVVCFGDLVGLMQVGCYVEFGAYLISLLRVVWRLAVLVAGYLFALGGVLIVV